MRKLLPFKNQSIIDTFPLASSTVSILSYYEGTVPYIITHYFMISTTNLDYSNGSMMSIGDTYKSELYSIKDILEQNWVDGLENTFINLIDNNSYVVLNLDHYYIPGCSRYQKRHFLVHRAMMYGYDTDKRIFYVADSFINGKFVTLEVSFADVEISRRKLPLDTNLLIAAWTYSPSVAFELDIELIRQLLIDYKNSRYTIQRLPRPAEGTWNEPGKERAYGISMYDYLIKYLMCLCESKTEFDHRGFHVLLNHMSILLLMVEHLTDRDVIQNKEIIPMVKELNNDCLKIRNLVLKIGVTKETSLIPRVIEKLRELSGKEGEAINIILVNI